MRFLMELITMANLGAVSANALVVLEVVLDEKHAGQAAERLGLSQARRCLAAERVRLRRVIREVAEEL
ncbi:MAG: hypothetical protein AAFU79_30670 [Myxococcota bacterium]